ncbi:DUF58 domain-containing protein [Iamia majanohamensis]|uniref:DUF58 domain-containing protein n=1 Tax=Iamia majanohamensis TaxID=467976 RepID=A0AAE9Y8S7_9ACTN|nr:DUF58 domain-containing protein [Iamia majanohamensis]WCO68865.1 DUF58 domain-containing protein [Iamia majanohamensis]
MPAGTRRLALCALALVGVRLLLPDSLPFPWWAPDLVLLAVAALDVALAVAPRSLEVGRDLPDQVALGATARSALVLRNPGGRAVRLAVADELAPSLRADTRRWTTKVPARTEARVDTRIRPGRRGRFAPTRVTLRSVGPLGLAARQATVDVPGELKVVPAFPSRADAELRLARARRLELGVRTVRLPGTGTDFDQLREYTPDDDFRRIDWAATARNPRPVVRTYRAERNQTIVTLLDVGRTTAGRVGDVPRLEHLLDATFALVTVATGLEDRIGVVAYDNEVRASLPPSHRPDQLARVVEATYDLEPALVETDHRAALAHTKARHRRRTTVVIATDLTEATVGQVLVPALPLVLRDSTVVVVAVADPEVAAWADAPVADDEAAFLRAAATSALEERARLAARLRGLGATVVDAPPGRLSGRLVDTYLDMR